MEKYLIWDKKDNSIKSLSEAFNCSQDDYEIVPNSRLNLYEIWELYKAPFIAYHFDEDYFVLIEKSPNEYAKKYRGNIYGKLGYTIKSLINNKSTQIDDGELSFWTFICLYR